MMHTVLNYTQFGGPPPNWQIIRKYSLHLVLHRHISKFIGKWSNSRLTIQLKGYGRGQAGKIRI